MTSVTSASSTWPLKPFAVVRSVSRVFSMRTTFAVRVSLSLIAPFRVSSSCWLSAITQSADLHREVRVAARAVATAPALAAQAQAHAAAHAGGDLHDDVAAVGQR